MRMNMCQLPQPQGRGEFVLAELLQLRGLKHRWGGWRYGEREVFQSGEGQVVGGMEQEVGTGFSIYAGSKPHFLAASDKPGFGFVSPPEVVQIWVTPYGLQWLSPG